jgi:hypothetical protein
LAAGAFLTGVEDDTGLGLTGVSLFAGVDAVSFLMAVGRGFLVAAAAGFEDVLTGVLVVATGVLVVAAGVFLTGVEAVTGLLAEAVGNVFCVPSGVLALTGVAFAGVGALGATGVEAVPAALSFFGTRFTGAAAASVALLADTAGFLTGVALVAVDCTALVGVAAVFFAVGPAP